MVDYQNKFLNSHTGKSAEELWIDFTSTYGLFTSQCISSKTVGSKKSLPWITQGIRRLIRKRDHLCRKFKNPGDLLLKNKFLAHRKAIKSKIKLSCVNYLNGLLGLNEDNSACDNKILFSLLKSSKQDQLGTPAVKVGNKLVTATAEKQVFTTFISSLFLPSRNLCHSNASVKWKYRIWLIVAK